MKVQRMLLLLIRQSMHRKALLISLKRSGWGAVLHGWGNQKVSSRTGNDGFKSSYPAGTVCRASISGMVPGSEARRVHGPVGTCVDRG